MILYFSLCDSDTPEIISYLCTTRLTFNLHISRRICMCNLIRWSSSLWKFSFPWWKFTYRRQETLLRETCEMSRRRSVVDATGKKGNHPDRERTRNFSFLFVLRLPPRLRIRTSATDSRTENKMIYTRYRVSIEWDISYSLGATLEYIFVTVRYTRGYAVLRIIFRKMFKVLISLKL